MTESDNPSKELTLIDPLDSNLKRAEYAGFRGLTGEVVYQVRQGIVLFSAASSSRDSTSTVNAAESVIMAICQAEGIDWKDESFLDKYRFFDLSTPIGYPGRTDSPFERLMFNLVGLGEIQIDELNIRYYREGIFVESWTPVDIHGRPLASLED